MASPLVPGEVIAQGRYRIERVVGEGGMGVVVLATHVGFDDKVAIKLLRPEVADNPEHVQRFLREGRAARKIRSEHVVQVTDVGTLESGAPYMVMEYLEGEDLAARLARTGPLSYPEAVELLLQACEAIAEAHVIGIVHRDLKPSNLFAVERRGGARFIKVLDFGISKITGGAGTTSGALTHTRSTMGSPLYMSPEQLHSARDVDSRADIWALGVILVELLTGKHPFVGEDIPRLVVQILAHPPSPHLTQRGDLPQPLIDAVMRCLEKDPRKRFQTVAELAVALAPVCSERARLSVDRIAAIFASSPAPPLSPAASVPPPTTTPWNTLAHAPTIPSSPELRSSPTILSRTGEARGATTWAAAVV
jgi:serine/threonine-protein kinase